MMVGIQLIGMLFGLFMIYLTYAHYKKNDYSWKSALIWVTVWLAFMVMIAFPVSVYGIMQLLEIQRTADFFVMSGFVLYAVIIFYVYITVKKNERKVENIVRALAFERQQPRQRETSTHGKKKKA